MSPKSIVIFNHTCNIESQMKCKACGYEHGVLRCDVAKRMRVGSSTEERLIVDQEVVGSIPILPARVGRPRIGRDGEEKRRLRREYMRRYREKRSKRPG